MQRIISLGRTISSIGSTLLNRNSNNVMINTKLMQSFSSTIQNNIFGQKLLVPKVPLINLICGFKIRGVVKRRCAACYFVMRDGRMHVICKKHPRHKQKAMRKKPHNTWILTHASQSPVRPW